MNNDMTAEYVRLNSPRELRTISPDTRYCSAHYEEVRSAVYSGYLGN